MSTRPQGGLLGIGVGNGDSYVATHLICYFLRRLFASLRKSLSLLLLLLLRYDDAFFNGVVGVSYLNSQKRSNHIAPLTPFISSHSCRDLTLAWEDRWSRHFIPDSPSSEPNKMNSAYLLQGA